MIRAVILALQIVASVIQYLERRRLINEGERRQINLQLEAVARAAAISKQVRTSVGKLNDDEINAALRGDFRD